MQNTDTRIVKNNSSFGLQDLGTTASNVNERSLSVSLGHLGVASKFHLDKHNSVKFIGGDQLEVCQDSKT